MITNPLTTVAWTCKLPNLQAKLSVIVKPEPCTWMTVPPLPEKKIISISDILIFYIPSWPDQWKKGPWFWRAYVCESSNRILCKIHDMRKIRGVVAKISRTNVHLPVPSQNDVMKPLLCQFQQHQADIKENRKLGSCRAKSY